MVPSRNSRTFTTDKSRSMQAFYRHLFFLLFVYCVIPVTGYSQQQQKTGSPFPKNWVGRWKGTLTWFQGLQQRSPVPMELHILPADSTDQYSWRIIYGTNQQDNRPYILKPFNKERGHWLIDELNSIVLDHFLIGDRLCGTFSVSGNTILNNYQVAGDSMIVEFFNYQEKPIVITGGADTTVPKIKTYGMRSHQRAILRRF